MQSPTQVSIICSLSSGTFWLSPVTSAAGGTAGRVAVAEGWSTGASEAGLPGGMSIGRRGYNLGALVAAHSCLEGRRGRASPPRTRGRAEAVDWSLKQDNDTRQDPRSHHKHYGLNEFSMLCVKIIKTNTIFTKCFILH